MMSLGMYALAMQTVQFFEYKLAILCTWAEIDLAPRKPPKDLERALKPLLRNITHAFQKASASELRNRLRDKVDASLIEEVSEATAWRDRLAHRYLREQYVLPPPIFGQVMYQEMETLAVKFDEINKRIDDETERIVAMKTSGSSEPAPHLEELAKRLMYGEL